MSTMTSSEETAATPQVKINLWDYSGETPPPFGHPMHEFFSFNPHYINLNHGAFGSVPTPVQRYSNVLADHIEGNPDKFIRTEYVPQLIAVRQRLAKFVGAHTDEVVLVPNATSAAVTVLRNFEWHDGDILIGMSTSYATVANTLRHIHDTHPGVILSPFQVNFPLTTPEILEHFKSHLRNTRANSCSSSTIRTTSTGKIVCVIDSITANPAILMPWKEMVKICEEEGAWSVVDAAHSIGQEPNIDLETAKPDFWFSNCHKWLYAKRACAALYVPRRNRHIIRVAIPTSLVYLSPDKAFAVPKKIRMLIESLGEGTQEDHLWGLQFAIAGTQDFTPYLSIAAALDFREFLGGEEVIYRYCHDLALQGGRRLAQVLGTRVVEAEKTQTVCMTNVVLPLPPVASLSLEDIGNIQDTLEERLLKEFNMYAVHFVHNGQFMVRCCAQIFNEVSDFEAIGEALLTICKEISQNFAAVRPS